VGRAVTCLGVIGGTGIGQLAGFVAEGRRRVETPYGAPSAGLDVGWLNGRDAVFLQRHGQPRSLPPHRINYRANLWALRECGVTHVVALNAVGGIHPDARPGCLVVPDQLIDYTWGREHTVDEGGDSPLMHIDFTRPYDGPLRDALLRAGDRAQEALRDGGVLGVTQGPRLETAAEVRRLRGDGCDLVGMTGMPEAAIAREMGLPYVSLCMVVNAAAGLGDEPLTLSAMEGHMLRASSAAARVLAALDPDAGIGVPRG
jgi:5'-methylthioinosine phosphorylase